MKLYGTLWLKYKNVNFQVILALARNLNFRWGHSVKISFLLLRLAVSVLNNKK